MLFTDGTVSAKIKLPSSKLLYRVLKYVVKVTVSAFASVVPFLGWFVSAILMVDTAADLLQFYNEVKDVVKKLLTGLDSFREMIEKIMSASGDMVDLTSAFEYQCPEGSLRRHLLSPNADDPALVLNWTMFDEAIDDASAM